MRIIHHLLHETSVAVIDGSPKYFVQWSFQACSDLRREDILVLIVQSSV